MTAVIDLKEFQRFEQRPLVRERNVKFKLPRPPGIFIAAQGLKSERPITRSGEH